MPILARSWRKGGKPRTQPALAPERSLPAHRPPARRRLPAPPTRPRRGHSAAQPPRLARLAAARRQSARAARAMRRASVIAIPADDPELEDELQRLGLARPRLASAPQHGDPHRRRPRSRLLRHRPPRAVLCRPGSRRPQACRPAGLPRPPPLHRPRSRAPRSRRPRRRSHRAHHHREGLGPPGRACLHLPGILPLTTARLRLEIEDQAAAIDWLARPARA